MLEKGQKNIGTPPPIMVEKPLDGIQKPSLAHLSTVKEPVSVVFPPPPPHAAKKNDSSPNPLKN